MELAVERWNVVLHDGAVAASALRREHVEVVVAAVGLAVAFMEAIIAELLTALGAEEVLGVPGLLEGCHAFLEEDKMALISRVKWQEFTLIYIQDWTVAVSTSRAEKVVVISLAVGCSVAFEEVPRAQLLIAMVARKVLRVPCLSKRRDHLTDDRLVACIAASLLHRGNTLTWHIRLKISKHKIELIASLFASVERSLYDRLFARLIVGDAFRWLHVIGDWLLLMLLLRWVDLHLGKKRKKICCETLFNESVSRRRQFDETSVRLSSLGQRFFSRQTSRNFII